MLKHTFIEHFILSIIYTCIWGQEFDTGFKSTSWQIQVSNRAIDVTTLIATFQTKHILGCATSCTRLDAWTLRSLYFNSQTNTCNCSSGIDEGNGDIVDAMVWYVEMQGLHQKEMVKITNANDNYLDTRTTIWPYHVDCLTLYDAGITKRGLYSILTWDNKLLYALCEQGYTVIQRRFDGSENFNRAWTEYANGFGNPTGEYWIGLDNIHSLTTPGSELIVYMEAFPDTSPSSMTAHFSHFQIADEQTGYWRYVSGFSGDCGNSFENGQKFSTYDNDNDRVSHNCAAIYNGGWWFRGCHNAYLNGQYYHEGEYSASNQDGIHWYSCWHRQSSQKSSLMKVKRKI